MRMNTKDIPIKKIAYKWISFFVLFAFIYYWIFTVSLVFFSKPTRLAAPTQSSLYSSLFNQNWRLFAFTKMYSTEVNVVVRKINDSTAADTIGIVSCSMAEKRKYAPFNNYEEALERMLAVLIADIGGKAERKKLILKKQSPGQHENVYVQEVSGEIEKDSFSQKNLSNLNNYAKYVLAHKHIDTSGKEFQLIIVHNYIKPVNTPVAAEKNANKEIIFISTYKPL